MREKPERGYAVVDRNGRIAWWINEPVSKMRDEAALFCLPDHKLIRVEIRPSVRKRLAMRCPVCGIETEIFARAQLEWLCYPCYGWVATYPTKLVRFWAEREK